MTTKYISDCKHIYSGINPSGMLQNLFQLNDYNTAQDACDSCISGDDVLTNNLGYIYGGSCSTASSIQDGNGYVSDDGKNYYQDSSFGANFPITDYSNPNDACENHKGLGKRFAENGMSPVLKCNNSSEEDQPNIDPTNWIDPLGYSGSAPDTGTSIDDRAMINSAISGGYSGVNSQEYFGHAKKKHSYVMILVVLIILAAAGFFIYKYKTKPKITMGCGMNFFY